MQWTSKEISIEIPVEIWVNKIQILRTLFPKPEQEPQNAKHPSFRLVRRAYVAHLSLKGVPVADAIRLLLSRTAMPSEVRTWHI